MLILHLLFVRLLAFFQIHFLFMQLQLLFDVLILGVDFAHHMGFELIGDVLLFRRQSKICPNKILGENIAFYNIVLQCRSPLQ